jgi:hypothetical protein
LVQEAAMGEFRKSFLNWFGILMAFFVLANLAGLVRPRGFLPFRTIGFPVPFKAWGTGVDTSFDWLALVANILLAFVASSVLGSICAWSRCRQNRGASQVHGAPGVLTNHGKGDSLPGR